MRTLNPSPFWTISCSTTATTLLKASFLPLLRAAFARGEVLKKSRHRECGFIRRSVDHREARRFLQAIVFDRLDNCPGYHWRCAVSLAGFDVPVDEHEDVVDNRLVQLLSLETPLDDFVYLIDSNDRHPSSSRWLKHFDPNRLRAKRRVVRTMPTALFLREKEMGKERVRIVGQTQRSGIEEADIEPAGIRHILIRSAGIYPNGGGRAAARGAPSGGRKQTPTPQRSPNPRREARL